QVGPQGTLAAHQPPGRQPQGPRRPVLAPPRLARLHLAPGLLPVGAQPQPGDLAGVDLVALGLAAVDGLPVQGMARTKAMPSCWKRSASPYQANRHSAPTTSPSRKGATAWRKASGLASRPAGGSLGLLDVAKRG